MQETTFRKTIVICWDEDTQTYIADVPDLPTCTGSGATYAEALASVLEALEWWQERTHRTRKPSAPPPNHIARGSNLTSKATPDRLLRRQVHHLIAAAQLRVQRSTVAGASPR